ncbi:hypothetical protein BJX76DRAFT_16590 [Aspergillus varians]
MPSSSDITTSPGAPSPSRGLPSDTASPSSQPATNPGSTSTLSSPSPSTSTSTSTSTGQSQSQSGPQTLYPGLGANFAHHPKAPFTVNYDQEVYIQLMAGEEGTGRTGTGRGDGSGAGTKKKNKTPTQIYREEWVRRALNPAISDPRGEPSSIDFECAENQRARDTI